MKKILLVSLLLFTLVFTGCGNKNTKTTSTNTKTAKFYSSEDANIKLLEYAITTGQDDSNIVIIEASDFECPACRYWHKEFKKIVDEFSDRVKFGYVAYPLNYHPNAMPSALAAEAAFKQDKGWEAHEYFFEGESFNTDKIDSIVNDLGLNADQYASDLESDEITQKISEGMELLNELNLTGTPTFFINGVMYNGNPSYDNLKAEIEKLL